jgi:hypothetical protein
LTEQQPLGETYRLLIKEKIMISDVAANNSYSVIQYYSSLLVLRVYSRRPYTVKKKVREFPVSSRDVTTKLSLGGNNDVITELFLLGCALTFASEAKFEIEAKISFRLEAKKKSDFT